MKFDGDAALLDDPPHPWDETTASRLADPPRRRPVVFAECAKSIITTNDGDDVPLHFGADAYCDCSHACIEQPATRDQRSALADAGAFRAGRRPFGECPEPVLPRVAGQSRGSLFEH